MARTRFDPVASEAIDSDSAYRQKGISRDREHAGLARCAGPDAGLPNDEKQGYQQVGIEWSGGTVISSNAVGVPTISAR
jgi:hypothetical protein